MRANKRKHPRIRARGVAANLRAQEVLRTGCVVENISAGGLLVRTEQKLDPGTPVVMDLVRPGMKKLLKLSGRVVGEMERVNRAGGTPTPPGLRIQFDPMPEETTGQLNQLLADLGLSVDRSAPPSPPGEPSGLPFLPAGAPQITWAPVPAQDAAPAAPAAAPSDLDVTRTMSAAAVQSALEAAEAHGLAPRQEPARERDVTQAAALTPPPILPLPPVDVPWFQDGPGASPPADARLMVQIRGLLMELGDVQSRLESRERELLAISSEVERLRLENRNLSERLASAEEQLRNRREAHLDGAAQP